MTMQSNQKLISSAKDLSFEARSTHADNDFEASRAVASKPTEGESILLGRDVGDTIEKNGQIIQLGRDVGHGLAEEIENGLSLFSLSLRAERISLGHERAIKRASRLRKWLAIAQRELVSWDSLVADYEKYAPVRDSILVLATSEARSMQVQQWEKQANDKFSKQCRTLASALSMKLITDQQSKAKRMEYEQIKAKRMERIKLVSSR